MTGCSEGSVQDENVRAAELQVFSSGSTAAVGAPDLEVTQVSATRVRAGEYTLTASVTNAGNEAAGASQTRFLRAATQLCLVDTPALAAGAVATVTCNWNTRDVKKGNYAITVVADSGNAVAESDENDNSRTVTVNVK